MTTVRQAGDAALLVEPERAEPDGNAAARLAAVIRAAALPGVTDVVPAAATVLVAAVPGTALAGLAARLTALASRPAPPLPAGAAAELIFDTVYDGPDLAAVAALAGLSTAEVIERHAAARYRVGWLGFSPGFGYLTGLDPALAAVPRLATPRLSVPAGSVAIAGGLAAVYPAASPGGWHLLGRTARPAWDLAASPPALLSPGRPVRFRPVAALPGPPGRPGPAARPAAAGQRWIEVIQPGPLATVQDLGRPGLAHLGVPEGGAADAPSLRRANALAGNPPGAAGLEITLGRLAVRFGADAVAAVTGAPVPLRLQPGPAAPAVTVPADAPLAVPAGSVLRLGTPAAGLRSYLAVSGGIDVPPALGSRAADLRSGLGPARLRPGQQLPLGPRGPAAAGPPQAPPPRPVPAGPAVLRVIAGPRADWFSPAALDALAGGGGFAVTPASDRTGLRLAGPALARAPGRAGELPSEGMAAGSLQVTHDGQPILLLADRPTTGGYPVIAVVVSGDLAPAAQLRPGQQVRFTLTPAELAGPGRG